MKAISWRRGCEEPYTNAMRGQTGPLSASMIQHLTVLEFSQSRARTRQTSCRNSCNRGRKFTGLRAGFRAIVGANPPDFVLEFVHLRPRLSHICKNEILHRQTRVFRISKEWCIRFCIDRYILRLERPLSSIQRPEVYFDAYSVVPKVIFTSAEGFLALLGRLSGPQPSVHPWPSAPGLANY